MRSAESSEAFVDEVDIFVYAGDGGDGCVSMRREKFVPTGGPDGGDGGRGGDVVFVADRNLATLVEQRISRKIRGQNGVPGAGRNKNGRNGQPTTVRVPVGTEISDEIGLSRFGLG